MKLYELLTTIHDQQDVDIFQAYYDEDHQLNYHIYGKKAYVSKAYDLPFYFQDVISVHPVLDCDQNIVLKIKCNG